MKLKFVSTVAFALFLTACGNSNDKAVGLYKYKSEVNGTGKILEVKKDGGAYLFVEDVIRKSNAVALAEMPDGLSYNNIPLKISKDGKTLYFSSINGSRVDKKYLDEKLAEIENNKKACAALQEEVKANRSLDNKSWNKYVKDLKIPEDCEVDAFMRF